MRKVLTLALLLLFTLSSRAATFTLENDGETLERGEICLFEAGDPDDPVKRLTTFTSVNCSAADASVALPEGTWNLFARHSSGFVSDLLLVKDGRVEGDQREIAMVPARPLSVTTSDDDERLAMYVEGWGTVIPLVPGETSVLVPSKERVFPLFLRDNAIESIGDGVLVDDGEIPVITRPVQVDGVRDLAVGVVPDVAAFDALPSEERLPGAITLSGTGLEKRVGGAPTPFAA